MAVKNLKHLHYNDYPVCPEENLWTSYTPEATTFKLWSPVAEEVLLKLYEKGEGGAPLSTYSLEKKEKGLWLLRLEQDLQGVYYTYQVKTSEKWLEETPGIYATAVGVNGKRAMVLDLSSTNPQGWEKDQGPGLHSPNDALLYELHVRDLSTHPSAGSSWPGKYAGITERGTKSPEGLATGLDHLLELGISHVHLLPVFDHRSVDEAAPAQAQFNWGYDPLNYNVPEGSYASDPFRAEVRIKEFKQMVKSLHEAGLGVVLDVVYNHTGLTENAYFNREVPGYYYRHSQQGQWSNASGCGNETASERIMMRKFIIESCKHWVREYHIDGFRFDLMAIHDIDTMNQLSRELKKISPHILLYGEGWTAGPSPLPESEQALKIHTHRLSHIAAFNDDLRDGLKGSVFELKSKGFASSAKGMEERVKFGIVGGIKHTQLDFTKLNTPMPWAREPWQAVSYVSCHDNHTLYDKLRLSCEEVSEQELRKMALLANAVVLTSQGIPFLHAGVEMMRTKQGAHNSYNLPDAINQLNWHWKAEHIAVFAYYQKLLALRKAHPAFRMPTAEMVQHHLHFICTAPGLIGYELKEHANKDPWKNIQVYYNARKTAAKVPVKGKWVLAAEGTDIQPHGLRKIEDSINIPPISMLILYQE